ncbi:DUF1499 domain-containing protein [Alterisphingorhabdus coralli]|uniref:DUF1499 domain-containing protein n=1 Tax=Alterisphingorhabdus coralli TaxID=3071408 RepID=A0AA97FAU7_9SPHN|nr:DUF1499 domain-containing protein [Parasphingorhabdus sp. SCSIO 66989]WOE76462.1 DUF1499 domain-containing protein [Parasphingorhabdus sp. SCSIO 66989]
MAILKYGFYVLVALVLVGVAGFFYLGHASQDGDAPGLVAGQLSPCPDSPNCVSSEQGTAQEKAVDTLPMGSWEKLPTAITDMGGTITEQNDSYVAAEFTESIFRFVDDVEFRLDGDAVHIRSASRVGHSDMGVNKARVDEIRATLEALGAAQ